jgi:hypothetical protein
MHLHAQSGFILRLPFQYLSLGLALYHGGVVYETVSIQVDIETEASGGRTKGRC